MELREVRVQGEIRTGGAKFHFIAGTINVLYSPSAGIRSFSTQGKRLAPSLK